MNVIVRAAVATGGVLRAEYGVILGTSGGSHLQHGLRPGLPTIGDRHMQLSRHIMRAAMPMALLPLGTGLLAQMTPEPAPPPPPVEVPSPPPAPETPPAPPAPMPTPDVPPPVPPAPPAPPEVAATPPGGIRWAPLAQAPAPAPQAAYPRCSASVTDQCVNARQASDVPRRKPRHPG